MIEESTNEFQDASLGDERLDARLSQVVAAVAAQPDAPFPKIFPRDAELEAFYRLLRNERVSQDNILEPHVQSTVERAAAFETVLSIHDTTEFRFEGERSGLGKLTKSGRGFLGHISWLVAPDENREPLGVAALETWARSGESATAKRKKGLSYREARKLPTEQLRWGRQVDEVEKRIAGVASLVHVMDSEADDYALLSKLVGDRRRFVIRLCYDRILDVQASGSSPSRKTKEFVARSQTVCTRTVSLSRRGRRPGGGKRVRSRERKERQATLAISAQALVLKRPSSVDGGLPRSLSVHIVAVKEVNPPKDVVPVEWLLITTEPIDTEEQILSVVDYYRVRWTVEEYFKALKTGCAYEKRQLESFETLTNALAIFVPIAWSLFRLRTVARRRAVTTARTVLTDEQIEVLRLRATERLPRNLSAQDAMKLIAGLGGHIRQNGDPGWQVLGRGYRELLNLVAAYRLLKRKM